MKKFLTTMIIVAFSNAALMAQDEMAAKKTIFSVGAEAGFPIGTAGIGAIYAFAVGGSLQVEYLSSPDFGLTLKAGYLNYQGKGGLPSDGLIPVLAGFRYHFNHRIYGSAQLGISLSTVSGGGSAFTYAPGVGFQITRNADVMARYEATSKNSITIGNIGVRLAYAFD